MPLLLAFGSNLGFQALTPRELISFAVTELCAAGLVLQAQSGLWRTPDFPAGNGPDFVNAAARFTSGNAWAAGEILQLLHEVEARMGRIRSRRWGARTLDIDLIAMGDSVQPDLATQKFWMDLPPERQRVEIPDRPILPHPRLQDRAFVLVPLAEVAPDWRHPVLGRSVTEMLAALPAADLAAITPLDGA